VARPRLPRPTDGELVILTVLWKRRRATVREIYDDLRQTRSSGYNSVLKLVQIMTAKGYVKRRDPAERPQVYQATLGQQEARRTMVRDLLDRVFGGSSKQLIQQALALKKPSAEELTQLREELERLAKPARKRRPNQRGE
jgi:BlaI family transcriptional regulator, penicillinase repressor